MPARRRKNFAMDSLPLPADIAVWYISSIVCTSGSKHLLSSGVLPSALWLTLLQLCIGSALGKGLLAFGLVHEPGGAVGAAGYGAMRWKLAATFVVGFGSLNASFSLMPASLAMTLRAAEPLFSVVLVTMFMGASERPSMRLCMSLVPIVAGTSMSSFGSSQFSFAGLALVCVANTAFPYRTVIYKQLRAATGEGNFTVFADVLWRAAVMVACVNIGLEILTLFSGEDAIASTKSSGFTWVGALLDPGVALQLLVNGVCYFTYLQWSFIVLSKVTVVSHAVGNSMRRPFNIVFAVWFFSTEITILNGFGILLACCGALLYSFVVKADETARKAAEAKEPMVREVGMGSSVLNVGRED